MGKYIKKFSETGIADINLVGGKNASLGEMFNQLVPKGILIPDGFIVTVPGFRDFMASNHLQAPVDLLLRGLDRVAYTNLAAIGDGLRKLMMGGRFPQELRSDILSAYRSLEGDESPAVAVRSSATAEDLPQASFAGQHDSFLNISGGAALIAAVHQCYASIYTDRAIKYREDKGFDHSKVLLSVGIQFMVRADLGASGVGFTLEPESGFADVVHLAGVWGLGENLVQGRVTPDEFLVFKPTLSQGFKAIIQKSLGSKSMMMAYAVNADNASQVINVETPAEQAAKFVLGDAEIERLAHWAILIEEHYKQPMDLEWAKDGTSNRLYILQARPETVHGKERLPELISFKLTGQGPTLTMGAAIGSRIVSGRARLLRSPDQWTKLLPGDILVTDTTSPDWDPVLKLVAGVVTNTGGRTSHAAIIARELGAAAIVGTGDATTCISDGELITLDCARGKTGYVFRGSLAWEKNITNLNGFVLPESPKAQLILSDPEKAFALSFLPNHGVGLLRMEFLISNHIRIHPMALVRPDLLTVDADKLRIERLTAAYTDKTCYFVDKLSKGVAMISAAFFPKEVIVRMSDFKSNEYAGLIGGMDFELQEENPMIGFRGASRYCHERYRPAFELECRAMKVVREEMGFKNVKLMIPFCRTPEEGRKVVSLMREMGLQRGVDGLEILVMAEIPGNVLLADQFAEIFDGFSIGSNDLTQLTLGIDRDSSLIADSFNEENAASLQLIEQMVTKAKKLRKRIGLCGQAPSDSATFTAQLVKWGIDSISFNPDALIRGILNIQLTQVNTEGPPAELSQSFEE